MGGKQVVPEIAKKRFDEFELKDLGEKFQAQCNKKGVIDEKTFCKAFLTEYPTLSKRFYKRLCCGKKMLVFEDWATGFAIIKKGTKKEKIEFLFKMFNTSGTGAISKKELASILSSKLFEPYIPKQKKQKAVADGSVTYLKANFDYDAGGDQELSFKAGDIMILKAKNDESWWWTQKGKTHGYAPANHVEEVEDVSTITLPKWATKGKSSKQKDPLENYVDVVLKKVDTNKNGAIERSEFMEWGKTSKELREFIEALKAIKVAVGFTLSAPREFKRTTHIGFDSKTGGFEIKDMPPEWKQLFKEAGISKKEAQNPEVARLV